MHPDDFKHLVKRLSLTRERLAEYLFERLAPCRIEFAPEAVPAFWPPPAEGWRTLSPGDTWGTAWQYGWFRIRCEWPESMVGKEPVLDLRLGGEGLVYTEDGHPLTAISLYSVYAPASEKHFVRLGHAEPAGELVFYVRCAAHFYNGLLVARGETPRRAPMNYTEYSARFTVADIGCFSPEVKRYLLLLHYYENLLKSVKPDPNAPGFLARKWGAIIRRSLNCYGEEMRNLPAAIQILEDELPRPAESWQPTAHAVGHAHLDIAWLWPVDEGVQKAVRTFSEQLTNIERHPGYIFGASQAYLYEQVKAFAPEVFERIRKAVAAGQWEIQGAMYVESDSNCTCGESLVRQFLYGKAFFQREFGVDVQNVWLPDSFGFSAVLPQIARQAGCFAMVTAKPFWASVQNKDNCHKFPYSTFQWRGLRDTLLVDILPMCYYNGMLTPDMLNFAADYFTENDILDDFLVPFGIGDGGGGPTDEMIERGPLAADSAGVPKARFSTAGECLGRQVKHLEELPVWDGEIYLECHRGTLSNIARMKQLNRQLERQLRNLETVNVSTGARLHPETLEKMWKTLLLNQFHDILPGSAIPAVYQRAFRELEGLATQADSEMQELVRANTRQEEDALLLFNPTSLTHHELVELPGHTACFAEITVPPLSSHPLHNCRKLAEEALPVSLPIGKEETVVLENESVRYLFDTKGRLLSARLKKDGIEYLQEGAPANILACYVDRPNLYDAWEIDREYMEMPPFLPEARLVEHTQSPACETLRFAFTWENSIASQTIRLASHSCRLDFVTEVEWHETHRVLRVAFPLALRFDEVRCDLDFGYIQRTALDNTNEQRYQFEFSCHKYIAAGNGNQRAALLNNGKYGASARNNTLGLTLLRSARYPDEITDRGHHAFTYSFLPYDGSSGDAPMLQEAVALNAPLLQFPGCTGTLSTPIQNIAIPGVTLEALKQAEDNSGDLILRLVEQAGDHAQGTLAFALPARISENNLLEQPITGTERDAGRSFTLAFRPFEIKTIRCKF